MAKSVARLWKVVINGVDLSDHAFAVAGVDEREKIDVSGFGGTKEYLPGSRDQSITISFLQDRAAGKVYQTIKPLYESGSLFPMYVSPDSSLALSTTNPAIGGTASVNSNPFGASLDEREEVEIEFWPSTSAGFTHGTLAI